MLLPSMVSTRNAPLRSAPFCSRATLQDKCLASLCLMPTTVDFSGVNGDRSVLISLRGLYPLCHRR